MTSLNTDVLKRGSATIKSDYIKNYPLCMIAKYRVHCYVNHDAATPENSFILIRVNLPIAIFAGNLLYVTAGLYDPNDD